MNVKPIRTEKDLKLTSSRIDAIIDSRKGTPACINEKGLEKNVIGVLSACIRYIKYLY
jgi:hypothetical protein